MAEGYTLEISSLWRALEAQQRPRQTRRSEEEHTPVGQRSIGAWRPRQVSIRCGLRLKQVVASDDKRRRGKSDEGLRRIAMPSQNETIERLTVEGSLRCGAATDEQEHWQHEATTSARHLCRECEPLNSDSPTKKSYRSEYHSAERRATQQEQTTEREAITICSEREITSFTELSGDKRSRLLVHPIPERCLTPGPCNSPTTTLDGELIPDGDYSWGIPRFWEAGCSSALLKADHYGRRFLPRRRFHSECERPHSRCGARVKFCGRGVKFYPLRAKFCGARHSRWKAPDKLNAALHKLFGPSLLECRARVKISGALYRFRHRSSSKVVLLQPGRDRSYP